MIGMVHTNVVAEDPIELQTISHDWQSSQGAECLMCVEFKTLLHYIKSFCTYAVI